MKSMKKLVVSIFNGREKKCMSYIIEFGITEDRFYNIDLADIRHNHVVIL